MGREGKVKWIKGEECIGYPRSQDCVKETRDFEFKNLKGVG